MAHPPLGLDPHTPARHLPPPWGRTMTEAPDPAAEDAMASVVQEAMREAMHRKIGGASPPGVSRQAPLPDADREIGLDEGRVVESPGVPITDAAMPELVCPVCGHLARSQKCKVVCAVCHTLIMNCSEF